MDKIKFFKNLVLVALVFFQSCSSIVELNVNEKQKSLSENNKLVKYILPCEKIDSYFDTNKFNLKDVAARKNELSRWVNVLKKIETNKKVNVWGSLLNDFDNVELDFKKIDKVCSLINSQTIKNKEIFLEDKSASILLPDNFDASFSLKLGENKYSMNEYVSQELWYQVMGETLFFSEYSSSLCDFKSSNLSAPYCRDLPIDSVSLASIEIFLKKLNNASSIYWYRLLNQSEFQHISSKIKTTDKYCKNELNDKSLKRVCQGGSWLSEGLRIHKVNIHDLSGSDQSKEKVVQHVSYVGFSGLRFIISRELR